MSLQGMLAGAGLGALLVALGSLPSAADEADEATLKQRSLVSKARAYQEGRVSNLEGDVLTLQPFQNVTPAAIHTGKHVPVFSAVDGALVSNQLRYAILEPGASVRVYYSQSGEKLEAVAIQLLPNATASSGDRERR